MAVKAGARRGNRSHRSKLHANFTFTYTEVNGGTAITDWFPLHDIDKFALYVNNGTDGSVSWQIEVSPDDAQTDVHAIGSATAVTAGNKGRGTHSDADVWARVKLTGSGLTSGNATVKIRGR